MNTLPLRRRLREEPFLSAMFSILPSTQVVEMIGLAGFDAVIIDMEHGPFSIDSLTPQIMAAQVRGLSPIVRVRSNDPALIGAALDAGAAGLLVPQVTTAAAARQVVAAGRFPPAGMRGTNPWVRAADYDGDRAWFARANAEVALMVMIEGREGIANLETILAVDELDGIFIGPVDMAQSLGVDGPEHPDVIDAIRKIVRTAKARGIVTAVFAPTAEAARRWRDEGVGLVALSEDTAVIRRAFRDLRAAIEPPA